MARAPGWLKIGVPVTVVLGIFAIGVTSAGRADRARAVREEWGQLLSCLAQASDPTDATALAARVRAVELHYLTSVDARRGRQLRKDWLSRCAIRATRIRDIARKSDGSATRLVDAMDELEDSLRAGRRPTRDALRDVLEAGAAVGLDTKALPSPQPGPVKGLEPRVSLDAAKPLAEAALSLTAWDPVPDLDAHFVLAARGGEESPPVACLATRAGEELLARVRCARVPDGVSPKAALRFEAPSESAHALAATIDTEEVALHTWHEGRWTPAGFASGELATFVARGRELAAVVEKPSGDVALVTLGEGGKVVPAPLLKSPEWAIAIGPDLVWATRPAGPVRGRILSVPASAATTTTPPTTIGERIEAGVPLACEDGPTRALLVDRPRPGGASVVARSAELFVAREGRWAQVSVVPSWTTRPTVGVAFPRTPVLDCWRDDVVLTWAEGDDQDRLEQTRCSQKGCRHDVAHLGAAGRDLLHADLGERVLLVWNDAEHHVVRFRLAPFGALATKPDEVLVDYDDDTTDPPPVRAQHIVTRDDAALVLLRVERKDRTQLVAVRLDATGRVRLPEVSLSP